MHSRLREEALEGLREEALEGLGRGSPRRAVVLGYYRERGELQRGTTEGNYRGELQRVGKAPKGRSTGGFRRG